eukprot:4061174-Prymnesium_polylepis.1
MADLKPAPKKQKSGHGPEKADRVRNFFTPTVSLIWVAEFEIGGRFSGRQIVQVWSDRFIEKSEKGGPKKQKWSGAKQPPRA